MKKNRVLFILLMITLIAAAGTIVYAAMNRPPKELGDTKEIRMDDIINSTESALSAPADDNAAKDSMAGESAPDSQEGQAGSDLDKTLENQPENELVSKLESGLAEEGLAEEGLAKEGLAEKELTEEEKRVDKLLSAMTLEEKVAQMFFVTPESLTGIETATATGDKTKAQLDIYHVGGLIYFGKNLETPEQTKNMLGTVQEYVLQSQRLPLFLGVDEEGGRVLRVGSKETFGVKKIEAMGRLAEQNDSGVIRDAGSTIGAYLKELGFNVDFAPDADVITNEENKAIGDRSFGTDPAVVSDMAWAYSEGLHAQGMLACYKHFPGHGGTVEDSHTGYAYSYKTLEELEAAELVPFQDGSSKGIDFIMVSHISTPNVTGSEVPASLSEMLVTDVLRNKMGYQGIIITDSMSMGAVDNHYSSAEAAVLAVSAGCDMILMPKNFVDAYNAVLDAVSEEKISSADIDASVSRIIRAKLKLMSNL